MSMYGNDKVTFQSFDGDLHLVPLTPITGRRYTINRPNMGTTPLTVVTSGLQKLYALLAGRKNSPSEELQEMLRWGNIILSQTALDDHASLLI